MSGDDATREASLWRRLFAVDVRSLALFRIGAGTLMVVDLALRLGNWRDHYTDAGVMPRETVLSWLGGSARASLYMLSDAPAVVLGLFVVHLLAAVAFALGWRTRLATAACWILTVSINVRNPGVVYGGDMLLRVLLFWSLFLPLGACWSLDARRDPTRRQGPGLVPSAAILLQVCFMYWFTVAHKWTPPWLGEQSAVAMALQVDFLTTSWGRILSGLPAGVLAAATTGTMLLESLGPLLAFSPWRTGPVRFVLVLVFVEFHLLGLGAALQLGLFSWMAACAWLLFLPAWFWERLSRRFPRTVPSPLVGTQRPGRRVRDVVVLVLLIWVFFINARRIRTERLEGWVPAPIRVAERVLGLNQAWLMFAPAPPSEDGWYVMPGLLQSGEVVDVWNGGSVDFAKPRDVAASYRDMRWSKLLSNLSQSQNTGLRPPFVRWLCRDWNEQAPAGRALVQVDVYYVMERFEAPDAEPEPIFLIGARCDA